MRSPIAGVVVQKLVSPGMLIQAGATVCFMISDVSTVWVQGHIFDRDLPTVRVGRPGRGNQPLLPAEFPTAWWPTSERWWIRPRAPLRSASSPRIPRGLLKKDMFVEADIHTGRTPEHLGAFRFPPCCAMRKNEPMVYVRGGAGQVRATAGDVGAQQGGMRSRSRAGLRHGENVVAEGSLFLQFANSSQVRHHMIARLVSFALRQPFLIVMAALMLMVWGAGLVPEAAHRRLSGSFAAARGDHHAVAGPRRRGSRAAGHDPASKSR